MGVSTAKVWQEDADTLTVESGGTINMKAGSTLIMAGTSTNAPVVVAAATTTLTLTAAAHNRRLVCVAPTGGLIITPPAATGTGNIYKVMCLAAVTGGSLTCDIKLGNSSDVAYGWIQTYKATTFTPYIAVANCNWITFNGTTTGGAAIGDWFQLVDIGTNKWELTGFTIQSGSIATPLSNH